MILYNKRQSTVAHHMRIVEEIRNNLLLDIQNSKWINYAQNKKQKSAIDYYIGIVDKFTGKIQEHFRAQSCILDKDSQSCLPLHIEIVECIKSRFILFINKELPTNSSLLNSQKFVQCRSEEIVILLAENMQKYFWNEYGMRSKMHVMARSDLIS